MDIIAVTVRLMLLPHCTGWLWSVHVSFGLNLGQIGGSEPKILGSCHPQTSVVRACEPISIWPQQRPPPSFWQTSKHWQWSGNSGYLRSLPTSRPHVHGMPSFLFLLLLYCHGLDRVPIWLGKSHFHQQVGWGTRLVMAQSAEQCEYEVWVPLRAVVDGVIKLYIWTCSREVA